MAQVNISIEGRFLGPMSVGTVSVVRLIQQHTGLSLREAKALVDRAVFEGQRIEIRFEKFVAARRFATAVRELMAPPIKVVEVLIEPSDFPSYLASTCAMLAAAYPDGLAPEDPDFGAVVTILAESCSYRCAASVLELVFERPAGIAYNEVLSFAAAPAVSDDVSRVSMRLAPHGFEAWRSEFPPEGAG
ncbi:MAG: hypothetical protein U0271_28245 [Polyangiaceae bacterium]